MPKVLGLTTSAFDPASRVRFIQFIPYLERLGWQVVHRPNVPDRQWSSDLPGRIPRALHNRGARLLMKYNRWQDVRRAASADVVFVNRDLAGDGIFFESQLLRRNPRVVFDFDDAIHLGRNEAAVRWMCRHAAWVTPGNEYLASYARQYSDRVTVVPTVIDTDAYLVRNSGDEDPPTLRVGWSGSDQSIRHTLFPFLPLLADLQKTAPFELVIVTNTCPQLPVAGLNWKFVPWRAEDETQLASRMDIGIMPLLDQEFQRGKCGFKLLQYMAAGLPTVASPVGVNAEITVDGSTGFSARTDREWMEALRLLLSSGELRARMGQAGRKRCVQHYSIEAWLPRISDLLARVAMPGRVNIPSPTAN